MPRSSRKTRRPTPSAARDSASIWLCGLHPVREAILASRRRIERLRIRGGKQRPDQAELVELARSAGIPIDVVDPMDFAEGLESDTNDQGVALRVGELPELSLDELLRYADRASGTDSRLVVLDGVEDPQNVGALARVAEAAGAHGLILTERRAPPLTAAVSRASAGAIEWLRVARVPNLSRALARLQESGYWVVAAAPASEQTLFEIDDRILTGKLAVVLGAEGKGIRRSILEQADHLVEIPMRGKIASLNVSAAGAVILYDLLRRSESAAAESIEDSGGVG